MAQAPNDVTTRPPWVGPGLFMSILFLATFLVLELQRDRLLQNAKENAEDDIQFIKSLLNSALQRQDYEHLSELVEFWGRNVRYTHELKITAANGFVLGHFWRNKPVVRPYQLTAEIHYSYRGKASVEFIKDLGPIDANVDRLRWELFVGLTVVGLALWRMAWLNLQRNREAQALDKANQRLRDSATQLRTNRAYLKNVFDSMPSTLIGVDEEGRIEMWNARAEQTSGQSMSSVLGKPFTEALPDLALQMQGLKNAIATGSPIRIERHASQTQDQVRYSEIVVYPLAAEGRRGAVIRIDDITQRVQMEQMMVQTEKMMTVGGLAAGMAHEINNPLSGMLQSSQNITRRLSPDIPANQQAAEELGLDLSAMQSFLERRGILEFLEGIRDAAERASRIVADMLAFSRRSTAEFSPVSMNDLLDTVIRIAASDYDLKKTYDFKRISIEKEYDPTLPSVSCDRTEIEQVLLNLVKNAAHAMAAPECAAEQKIVLRTVNDGDFARIEVQDTGPGMDETTRQRVFEPFFTTKDIGVGTGLGLSVSYYIITEQHKGTISVESSLGEGSTFVIRLPLHREA